PPPVDAGVVHGNGLPELSERARTAVSPEDMPAHPGVIALADQVVRCEHPELAKLPALLLGCTLIVLDLDTARSIAGRTSGYRFITLHGELLEPDGTLTIGTHHAQTGILSRKSELRELREQVEMLDRGIGEKDRALAGLRQQVESLDRQALDLQEEADVLAEQGADLRSRISQHRERREGLHE